MEPVGLQSVVLDSVALDAIYLRPTGWETLHILCEILQVF